MSHAWRLWPRYAAGIIAAGICIFLFALYGSYLEHIPYFFEAMRALRTATPVEAYNGFQVALRQGDIGRAERYLTRQARRRYSELLHGQKGVEKLRRGVSNLREIYTISCDGDEICSLAAVYGYTYEVESGYETTAGNKTFFVRPGAYQLEMRFIRLRNGRWQISQL